MLGACGGPGPSEDASGDAAQAVVPAPGMVVVNRSRQPVSPAPGFVIPACAEVFYDTDTLRVISARIQELGEWPGGVDGEPPPPVGRLDVFYAPDKGRWYMLVSSVAGPQLYFDNSLPADLRAEVPQLRPRPDEWPECAGQAILG